MTLPKISSFIIRTISIDDWSKHIIGGGWDLWRVCKLIHRE